MKKAPYSCCYARESRAAPQAGAIPPWPSPPIARNLLRPLSLFRRQVGVSCIIKCPVTGVNPNLFCSLTWLRFGAPAFVSPRLSFLRSRPRGEPWRLRAEGRGGYVQARTVGATTIGAERVAADKVEAYDRGRKDLPLGLHS